MFSLNYQSVKSVIATLILFATTVGWGQSQANKSGDEEKRPNILFVLLDNIGKDWFRYYGSQEDVTRNIDRLAQTGVKFRTFYVTPVCSTTRVALLTRHYPFRTDWHTHHDPAIYGGGYFDWNREISIARVLRDTGYRTFISGKWKINDLFDPNQREALKKHGFDEHCIFPEGKKEHPAHKKRYWDPYIIENGQGMSKVSDVTYPRFIEQSGHHGSTFFEHQAFIDRLEGKTVESATVLQGLWAVIVAGAAQESLATGEPVLIKDFVADNQIGYVLEKD